MEIRIDKSFEKDIKKIKQPDVQKKVATLIEKIQEISSFQELTNTKKIKGSLIITESDLETIE